MNERSPFIQGMLPQQSLAQALQMAQMRQGRQVMDQPAFNPPPVPQWPPMPPNPEEEQMKMLQEYIKSLINKGMFVP